MDIEEMLNDKDHVITDPYVRSLLEKRLLNKNSLDLNPLSSMRIIKKYKNHMSLARRNDISFLKVYII